MEWRELHRLSNLISVLRTVIPWIRLPGNPLRRLCLPLVLAGCWVGGWAAINHVASRGDESSSTASSFLAFVLCIIYMGRNKFYILDLFFFFFFHRLYCDSLSDYHALLRDCCWSPRGGRSGRLLLAVQLQRKDAIHRLVAAAAAFVSFVGESSI